LRKRRLHQRCVAYRNTNAQPRRNFLTIVQSRIGSEQRPVTGRIGGCGQENGMLRSPDMELPVAPSRHDRNKLLFLFGIWRNVIPTHKSGKRAHGEICQGAEKIEVGPATAL
jgi:hypothetical protein